MHIRLSFLTAVVATVLAVAAMHEDVQQGAGKQEQNWQETKEVGPMLRDEIEARNGKKSNPCEIGSGPPTLGVAVARALFMLVLHCSDSCFRVLRRVLASGCCEEHQSTSEDGNCRCNKRPAWFRDRCNCGGKHCANRLAQLARR
jgi:hypothetical protein